MDDNSLIQHFQPWFVDKSDPPILLKDKLYISKTVLPNISEGLLNWYKAEALTKINERCEWYTKLTGYKPVSIKITDARKRWGSCGTKGTLNFSWRLIMAPLKVIDLVIVHELVHLEQPNHSKLYWNKIRSIFPDYEKRQQWLKDNDHLLRIQ